MTAVLHRRIGQAILACLTTTIASADDHVDFRNDVMPVFTKYGCNAGACHGAALGRGGFKLSLYGGDPDADYDAIVRQVSGRRVNLAKPDRSLIVLKPTEHVEHGGGNVFDDESAAAELLRSWVAQGASDESVRQLERVEITPQRYIAQSLNDSAALRATAHFSDGSSRDVTSWTNFTPEDKSAVRIATRADGDELVATPLRRGRHVVVGRYLSEVVPVEVVVPLSDTVIDLAGQPRHNFIDDEILLRLQTLRLAPSPVVNDATFLRRITLDLTGRLPTIAKVSQDQHDAPASESAKSTADAVHQGLNRAALIDDLLASDEFTEYWTFQLAKLLRLRPSGNDQTGAETYHAWLAEQVREDASYRDLARALITATGDTHEHGPANFYRTTKGAREQAEFFSELLMANRLRCANCHNHPLDRWTQDDYHGLAAIFAKVESGRVVQARPRGEVTHPRTLEPAIARIPGEHFMTPGEDERERLADWLTDADNPYFAKAIVNRLWKRMMGRGLVEPVDDFRATNPATHPALLERLAEDFVAQGYSIRHTLRMIANSATYARSANATTGNKDDDRFYSHAMHRPLEPEVLADAISDVLGIAGEYGDEPTGTRAVALVNPRTPSRTLDVLGRCGRDDSCEDSVAAGGLPQKLHLFNGPLLNARIPAEGSRLQQLLSAGTEPLLIVDAFYNAALSRHPSDQERSFWREQLAAMDAKAPELASRDKQRAFFEDFVWGLMTCEEFVTNH